jgi:hypothetical protein
MGFEACDAFAAGPFGCSGRFDPLSTSVAGIRLAEAPVITCT